MNIVIICMWVLSGILLVFISILQIEWEALLLKLVMILNLFFKLVLGFITIW